MKYVAQVKRVLHPGIHKVAEIRDGDVHPVANLPHPTRVEIEAAPQPDAGYLMYRYTDANEFCGDTWHQSLADAYHQAEFEYGLGPGDFKVVQDDR